ncbi:MAG: ABC transporter substrate-binding protein [Acetivibrionales bacterium]
MRIFIKNNEIIINSKIIIILIVLVLVGIAGYLKYDAGKPVVLKVAVHSGNSWSVPQKHAYAIYDEAVKLFEKKYRNVKVELKTGRLIQHYSEWFAQQVLKGEEADVFLVLEEDFNTYASIGLFENLTPYIEKDRDFNIEEFYPESLHTGQYYGNQYTLPFELAPSFMVVNKTLLEQEGIHIDPDEWTWDSFYRICKDVTKDIDNNGYLDQFGVYGYDWEHAFYTNDYSLFTQGGKSIAFNDDRLFETIEFMKRMYELNKGIVVREEFFAKGQVAFKIFTLPEYRAYGSYPYRIIKYKEFEWEAIPFPSGPNGRSSSKLYAVQIGMSSRSENKKMAYELIKHLTNNREVQCKIWDYTYTLPANKEVVRDIYDSNTEEIQDKVIDADFLNNAIKHSYMEPNFKLYSHLKKLMDQKIFQIIAQDLDTREGIKEIREEIENIIY